MPASTRAPASASSPSLGFGGGGGTAVDDAPVTTIAAATSKPRAIDSGRRRPDPRLLRIAPPDDPTVVWHHEHQPTHPALWSANCPVNTLSPTAIIRTVRHFRHRGNYSDEITDE